MLPAVVYELDTRSLRRAAKDLERALDDELEACVVRVTQDVAHTARVIHGFVNRTGRLEGSIETVPPTGVFTRGTLQGAVVATAPYAEFVERRADLAFLGPAWAANEARASQHLDDALERAVARSGWK
jgi:hypothetical protein